MTQILFLTILLLPAIGLCKVGPPLIIGVENIDYRPYYYTERGNYRGFARELFDDFGKKYGHLFTYAPMPIPRLYRSLINEQNIDFKFPDHPAWGSDFKQQHKINYSAPVVNYTDGMLSSNKNDRLSKICTVTGFTMLGYEDLIKERRIERRDLYSFEEALKLYSKKEVEGIYGNYHVLKYLCQQAGLPQLELNINYPMSSSEYYLSTIKHPKVLKDFADYLDKNGEFVTLLKIKHQLQ